MDLYCITLELFDRAIVSAREIRKWGSERSFLKTLHSRHLSSNECGSRQNTSRNQRHGAGPKKATSLRCAGSSAAVGRVRPTPPFHRSALRPKPRCSPPRAGALFAPGQHPPPFCAERTASRPTPPPLRPACFRSPQLTVAAPAASDAHPRPHGPSAGTAATSPECTPKISTGGHGRT